MCGGVFLFDFYWWCIYFSIIVLLLGYHACRGFAIFNAIVCVCFIAFLVHGVYGLTCMFLYSFVVIVQYFRHVCAINLWMVFIWCDVGVYWFCYGFCLLLMYVCGCMSIGFILVLHMFCFNLYIAWFHCWASIWDFHFFWFCFVFMHCWFDLACFFKYSFDLIF